MLKRKNELLNVPPNETVLVSLNPATISADNQVISVIIRSHKSERMSLLDEALFSLALQDWPEIEPVIVLQNGTEELKQEVTALVERQPWRNNPVYQILLEPFPPGVDGRSTMLTKGIRKARGRFLAFLDDDDCVYHHGYRLLINRLMQCECAIAVGGTRTATMTFENGSWYFVTKASPFVWGNNKSDLLYENFIPIHSYVMDRSRISTEDLYFDDEAPPLEDYEFLLRLAAKYEFDFKHLKTPVCEYRWHADNSMTQSSDPMGIVSPKVMRARQKIFERKQEIQIAVPISQWIELRHMLACGQVISNTPDSRQRMFYKLADKFYASLDRSPGIAKLLGRMSYYIGRTLGLYRPDRHVERPKQTY
jgi:hypothetical protein